MKSTSRVAPNIKKLVTSLVSSTVIATLFLSSPLKAILDGRTTPIYLDTVYTFTQGEWARGSVYFRNGFDLPVGGTVYLGIDTGFVNGLINLNGGTLILQKALPLKDGGLIVAPGFIKASYAPRDIIIYENAYLFSGSGTIKLLSGFIFQAQTIYAGINTQGIIDFREANGDIYFLGGKIFFRFFITSSTSPNAFWFWSADVTTAQGYNNLPTPNLYFSGNCSLTTLSPLTIGTLLVQAFAKMIIYPGSSLRLNKIDLQYKGTRLEVRQSSLDFVSTSTALLRMINHYSHNQQGAVSFVGKCSLSSSTNNTLIFDKAATLELQSGALLKLKNGTHLVME